MNLAQVIDPERLYEDDRPRQPSPRPPMGVVTHECQWPRKPGEFEAEAIGPELETTGAKNRPSARSGCSNAIRQALAAKTTNLQLAEICAAITGFDERRVSVTLYNLVSQADITRSGFSRSAYFALTKKGRAKLKAPPP